jgi:hypothetical protein
MWYRPLAPWQGRRVVIGYDAGCTLTEPVSAPWAALVVPPEINPRVLIQFLEFLSALNEDWLREHPEAPNLYDSGAWYELRRELWFAIPWALWSLERKVGLDCKTLSAWRVAELRVRGGRDPSGRLLPPEPRAQFGWDRYVTDDKIVYHVWVKRQSGQKEDPSALLGMNSVLPSGSRELPPWTPSARP